MLLVSLGPGSSMVRFSHETGLLAEQEGGGEREVLRKQTLARMIAVLQEILKVQYSKEQYAPFSWTPCTCMLNNTHAHTGDHKQQ